MWKGIDAGYVSKHMWIYNSKGKPTECEHCGKNNLTGHKIHWANKSGEYLRDLNDWIRLCVKCHIIYDKRNSSQQAKKAWITKREKYVYSAGIRENVD